MTDSPRTPLDEAWEALRDGLSKAYVAKDIDNALSHARSRIEAAPCSQCAAWHDIGHRFLATSGSRAALESTT